MLVFANRQDFRTWLCANCAASGGVWLLFGKPGGPATLTAGEALEEALCFGWIDGQMQRLDDKSYRKYFSRQQPPSVRFLPPEGNREFSQELMSLCQTFLQQMFAKIICFMITRSAPVMNRHSARTAWPKEWSLSDIMLL